MTNSQSSHSTVINCIFLGNNAETGGGMDNRNNSEPMLVNCTFSDNAATNYGGGICCHNSNPSLSNCILWDNIAPGGNEIALQDGSVIYVNFCDLKGGQAGIYDDLLGNTINWGIGNIDTDPLFADPNGPDGISGTEDDNLRLLADSPCIDTGDNSIVDANITDLDGNLRILDGDRDGEAVVDMGAYEFLPPIEADVHIVPSVINRRGRMRRVFAIVRLPEGVGRHDIADELFMLYPDDNTADSIEAIWQRVIGRGNMTRVFVLFDKDELMNSVAHNGRVEIVELTVVGKLESGQYIQGSDTIRIIQPRRRSWSQRGHYRRR